MSVAKLIQSKLFLVFFAVVVWGQNNCLIPIFVQASQATTIENYRKPNCLNQNSAFLRTSNLSNQDRVSCSVHINVEQPQHTAELQLIFLVCACFGLWNPCVCFVLRCGPSSCMTCGTRVNCDTHKTYNGQQNKRIYIYMYPAETRRDPFFAFHGLPGSPFFSKNASYRRKEPPVKSSQGAPENVHEKRVPSQLLFL